MATTYTYFIDTAQSAYTFTLTAKFYNDGTEVSAPAGFQFHGSVDGRSLNNNAVVSKDKTLKVYASVPINYVLRTWDGNVVDATTSVSRDYSLQTVDPSTGEATPKSGSCTIVFERRYSLTYAKPSQSEPPYMTANQLSPYWPSPRIEYSYSSTATVSGLRADIPGWKFLGWTDSGGNLYQAGSTVSLNKTLLVSIERYTLTYDSAGGNGVSPVSGYGAITLSGSPGHPYGVSFLGWQISGEDFLRAPGSSYNLQSNVTATARWNAFSLRVTKSFMYEDVGTLFLVRSSNNELVAQEDENTHELSYFGEAGVTYTVGISDDGTFRYYDLVGIEGWPNNSFTPNVNSYPQVEFVIRSKPWCPVLFPSASIENQSLQWTWSPQPDGGTYVNGRRCDTCWILGTTVTIQCILASGWFNHTDFDEIYIDNLSGSNIGTLTRSQLNIEYGPHGQDEDGNITCSFVIPNLSEGIQLRVKTRPIMFDVSASADPASSAAFGTGSITVTANGGPVSSVAGETEVTFAATPNEGFEFEGWYLDGDKVMVDDGQGGTEPAGATYTTTINESTELVAKAKVAVTLGVSDGSSAAITVDGAAYTPDTPFYVTLGESFSYAVTVGEGEHFWGWYAADDTDHSTPISFSDQGTWTPTGPVDVVAWIREISPETTYEVSVYFANRSDSTMGGISIDGSPGTSVAVTAGTSVKVVARPRNGFVFTGWFVSPAAYGAIYSGDEEYTFTVNDNISLYALFSQNPHQICEWEGEAKPKPMRWRSKTYESSKPFAPSACRVDALEYPPAADALLELTVDMFSAPNTSAAPTGHVTLGRTASQNTASENVVAANPYTPRQSYNIEGQDAITSQNARRLPILRQERYMQIEVKANAEVDALLVGTSMGGLAT